MVGKRSWAFKLMFSCFLAMPSTCLARESGNFFFFPFSFPSIRKQRFEQRVRAKLCRLSSLGLAKALGGVTCR